MSLYPVNGHQLLSAEAAALADDALEAETRVAERLLGLRGTAFTGADVADAEDAVALQVSLQVASDPESYVAESVTRGSRSMSYRDGVLVHPRAVAIVGPLLEAAGAASGGSAWATIQSFR